MESFKCIYCEQECPTFWRVQGQDKCFKCLIKEIKAESEENAKNK